MLRRVAHRESDRDFLIETVYLAVAEIGADFESETVNCRDQGLAFTKQIACSAVIVGFLNSDSFPVAIIRLTIELHRDAGRGLADRNIKNMRGYCAHGDKSFFKRISVIFSCSAAAIPISVSRSFPSRAWQSSNISSALFPVAHTMNINPNLSK